MAEEKRLADDCFALPGSDALTPVDTALARLREGMAPVTGIEPVPAAAALGRVLSEPVRALRAHPPGANAAVDGYGFAAAAMAADGSGDLRLVEGRAAAGVPFAGVVPVGAAVRVLTGALLPAGVDTVVMQEEAEALDGRLRFAAGLKPGANARAAGEDVQAGDEVLAAGRRLRAPDLGLISAVGQAEVMVFKRLRVGVLSSGDEICAPGTVAAPHQTYDANRPMLLAMLRGFGHQPVDLGHVRDDPGALRRALDDAAGRCDAVLTSGGASAGDEDHLAAVLRAGGRLETWRIAMKPGRPLALGLWQGVPVFGLPGNPVAACVCALVFAYPALGALAGAGFTAPVPLMLPAGFTKRKKAGRREYLRARIGVDGRVACFASEGSGRISGLSWAEGVVELPDTAAEIAPGDLVRYYSFSQFGL